MPNIKLAQQAVAVEACKKLHQCGELDDNLMPIGKETVKYAEELYPWKPEQSTVFGRPGSTKRRQTYAKDIPVSLTNCLPTANKPVFIYEVEMHMKSPLPEELNIRKRKTYFPEETSRCFGVATTKPIPLIPGTPIFTRSGEETARLSLRKSYIIFSEQQIKLIKSFHNYVFSDMLRVDRVPLFFKPEVAENQWLVLVLNYVRISQSNDTRIDIDWNFMMKTDLKKRIAEKMKKDPWYNHRMAEKKKNFKYERSIYEDAVVVRNYGSCDQPNRYYVAEIKDHLNPASPFPSADYKSYMHYYEAKYGVDIRCTDQPLLDVDHTPSRLNLLTPRHAFRKGKISREKKSKQKNPVIFVPELCDVHPVPASLWRKAVCLPSVLYRVSQLLIGEELRRDIASKSGIVKERPPLGHSWPDIEFQYPPDEDFQLPSFDSDLPSLSIQLSEDENEHSRTQAVQDVMENILQSVEKINATLPSSLHNDSSICENKSKTISSSEKTLPIERSSNHLNSSFPTHNGTNSFSEDDNDSSSRSCDAFRDRRQSSPKRSSKNPSMSCDSEEEFFSDDYQASFLSGEELEVFSERRRKRKMMFRGRARDLSTIPLEKSDIVDSINSTDVSPSKIGPGPEIILQALTLSNASDGYNLERMEMLGDSFLKHAVTLYLYCTYPDAHEGKLSYMRSKKVSNYNLYRIGRSFGVAGKMTAHIFDPIVNWLPAGYTIGYPDHEQELSDDEVEIGVWTGVSGEKKKQISTANSSNAQSAHASTSAPQAAEQYEEDDEEMYDEDEIRMIDGMLGGCLHRLGGSMRGSGMEKKGNNGMMGIDFAKVLSGHASMHFTDKAALKQSAVLNRSSEDFVIDTWAPLDSTGKPLSNNDPLMLELHTQHSLSDKSIADSVEALLGAYLTACGHRPAQLLLCHLGLMVLPELSPSINFQQTVDRFGHLVAPPNHFITPPSTQNNIPKLLQHLRCFERKINYDFRNKAYLLQAFTHASYYYNTVTDCYQRLEFLGDAVLDFLITRHLCADERQHSPGALTDLRCALVNNTIFASLAVRYEFHKYFKAISPELQLVIEEFVSYQQRQEEAQGMDAQLMRDYGSSRELDQSFIEEEEEEEENEDVEVPKALGDVFESVAGAVFMDSGMDLDAVWNVYSVMMLPLIEKFSSCVPRSPVRELLEMEPETAKFSCAEKRFDGKIRVTVEIIGKGRFKGVGRSYRIAKSAAARRALRFLKRNFC